VRVAPPGGEITTHVMENTVTAQPTALKPSLVKTTEFELERLTLTEICGCVEKPQIFK